MIFKYTAQKDGRNITGTIHADDVSSVVFRLSKEGLLPIKIKAIQNKEQLPKGFLTAGRVKSKELVVFTRQLAATLASGLLLTDALETIAEDVENKYFQTVILSIAKDIRGGADFSTTLLKYPRIFPKTYTAIIKSGEATGRLDRTTNELARYIENSERMKEKVVTALRYPLFVIGFAIAVVLIIVLFLIPKFKSMFESAGGQLPLLTRIVVGISETMIHAFPIVLLGIVAAFFAFWIALKNPKFRHAVDYAKFKIPIVGKNVIYKGCISSFCRTLSVLIEGSVGLSTSLEITAQVVNHRPLAEAIMNVRQRVVAGSDLTSEIRGQKIFSGMVKKMVAVGEKTGKVSEMLKRTADYYDDELDNTLSRLTVLLEPALIIFIGGIVLVVVLALYLPIFKISGALR